MKSPYKYLAAFVAIISASSCQTNSQMSDPITNGAKISVSNQNKKGSSLEQNRLYQTLDTCDSVDNGNPPSLSKVEDLPSDTAVLAKLRGTVDFSTPHIEFTDPEPGVISVIFREQCHARVNENKKWISSTDENTQGELSDLLNSKEFLYCDDISGGMTEEVAESIRQRSCRHWGKEMPGLLSSVFLHFSPSADTKAIVQKLRKNPFVVSATLTPKVFPTGQAQLLSRAAFASQTQPPGTGPDLSKVPPVQWYHLPLQHAFEAWSYADATGVQQPEIAIVDQGFDISPAALARPSYDLVRAAYIDSKGVIHPGDSNVQDTGDPNDPFGVSHGTMCASVVSSPLRPTTSDSAGNYGICGNVPKSTVVPIRIVDSIGNMIAAINYVESLNLPNLKVISLSFSAGDDERALTTDPNFLLAAATADARGYNIVISAGNENVGQKNNPQPYDQDTNNPSDGGAVIVGGVYPDGYEDASSGYGSILSVCAGDENLWLPAYLPIQGKRTYNIESGTSFAVPQVAGALALARNIYVLRNGSATGEALADVAKQLVWGTADILPSNTGHDYGRFLNDISRNTSAIGQPPHDGIAPGANIRSLNLYDLVVVASQAQNNLVARIMNSDASTFMTVDGNWGQTIAKEGIANDALWDLGALSFNVNSYLSFYTYSSPLSGKKSHGYQIWQRGILKAESFGGAVQELLWNNTTRPTINDSIGKTSGWYIGSNWSALGINPVVGVSPPPVSPAPPNPLATPTPLPRQYAITSWANNPTKPSFGALGVMSHVKLTAGDKAFGGLAAEVMWARPTIGIPNSVQTLFPWLEVGYTDGPITASGFPSARNFYWANCTVAGGQYQDYQIMSDGDSPGNVREYRFERHVVLNGNSQPIPGYLVSFTDAQTGGAAPLGAFNWHRVGFANFFTDPILQTDHGFEATARGENTFAQGQSCNITGILRSDSSSLWSPVDGLNYNVTNTNTGAPFYNVIHNVSDTSAKNNSTSNYEAQ